MSWRLEVTDTFGGEANYCWVRRGFTKNKNPRRALKALMGLTGQRATVDDRSDEIEIRPAGRDAPCIIGWAFWTNEEAEDALEH